MHSHEVYCSIPECALVYTCACKPLQEVFKRNNNIPFLLQYSLTSFMTESTKFGEQSFLIGLLLKLRCTVTRLSIDKQKLIAACSPGCVDSLCDFWLLLPLDYFCTCFNKSQPEKIAHFVCQLGTHGLTNDLNMQSKSNLRCVKDLSALRPP